ncbi:MAG: hypothetical protein AAAB35_22720 [Phyllobacterium sp.]|uniref:hypothetical protein n=1 Tax=Phyllobacterium sp. TaxID=1871046 RepID=UPI0030F0E6A7
MRKLIAILSAALIVGAVGSTGTVSAAPVTVERPVVFTGMNVDPNVQTVRNRKYHHWNRGWHRGWDRRYYRRWDRPYYRRWDRPYYRRPYYRPYYYRSWDEPYYPRYRRGIYFVF